MVTMKVLAFFNGILFFYTRDMSTCVFLVIALFLKTPKKIIIYFLIAYCWSYIHQLGIAESGMPAVSVINHAHILGEVISIPFCDDNKIQFQFKINQLNNYSAQTNAIISCYQHCPSFKSGELWSMDVKLKRPINLGNPGAANTVSKLVAGHLYWLGTIQGSSAHRLRARQNRLPILAWREKLAAQFNHAFQDKVVSGIIQALTLGISKQISRDEWQLFRQTGTTHLMVISGAHIGLVGGFFYFLGEWLWRRSARLCLWCPSQQAGSILAIFAGIFYASLAGLAIPAERAVIASILLFSQYFLHWRFTAWQAWRYALFVVLLNEPHAVLLPGFYLSFMAVAILIGMSQRILCEGWQKMLMLQAACLFGLMPMTLYWFSYSAINGFFANLIAIPWVGYILVPLSLVALCMIQLTPNLPILVPILNALANGLLHFLSWIDTFSWMNFSWPLHDALAMMGMMLVFTLAVVLPIPVIWPALGVIMLSCCLPFYSRPQEGDAKIDVLDVGQGLAVFIQTAHHQLLYDTGMAFYAGGDMGQFAILPYLHTKGIRYLDAIVISHPDLDHRGGLASIERSISVKQLIVNDVAYYHRGQNCHRYSDWRWDGVRFHFISLEGPGLNSKNNNSCVLKVTTAKGSVLIPGDIEKEAEAYLVSQNAQELAASFLVVAHHGSKTSSTPAFIHQVAPRYAIISAGFDNRYHFPHQQTLSTFAHESIPFISTIDCGMVSISLPHDGKLQPPSCFKSKQSDYSSLIF